MARNLGHSVIKPYPSLFSFRVSDKQLTELAGISLHAHAMLKIKTETNAQVAGGGGGGGGGGEKKFVDSGPLLITHWGLSGPLVLKLSAWYDSIHNHPKKKQNKKQIPVRVCVCVFYFHSHLFFFLS